MIDNKSLTGLPLLKLWHEAKYNGETLAQFAQRLGMSFIQVKSRLQRARAKYKNVDLDSNDLIQPNGPGVAIDTQGNYMALESSRGDRITTLDQLLAMANVDLDEWKVERYVVNAWEVGRRHETKHLVWEDGKIIEGEANDTGEINPATLYQVKAWLIRKHPVAIEPVLSPMAINLTLALAPSDRTQHLATGLESALILPDVQTGYLRDLDSGALVPFHDRRAIDVALQIAEANHFDHVIWLGDLLDLPDWSDKFLRSPEFTFTTQSAIIELAWWMAQFKAAQFEADHYALEGNHDERMKRAMMTHLAAAYNLRPASEINLAPSLSVPRLLDLAGMGIEWVDGYPDSIVWLNDQLAVTHGNVARGGPGDSAKAIVTNSIHSVIFGHIHRIERATKTLEGRFGRQIIKAVSPGCLCRVDWVVPGHNKGQNWQQGIGVAYFDQNGTHEIEIVPIENGRAVWAGKIYEARDRLPDLAAQTGWKGFQNGE